MTALSVQPPYPIITDIDGQPLEGGYIWIGQANLDPQTNPITVYWDKNLTIAATQPIRTTGGYPVNSGTPARLYVNSAYSIRVMNKNGSVIYNAPSVTEQYSDVVFSASIASTAEAQAATSNTVLMSPLRVKEAMQALSYAVNEAQGTDIASASTINLTNATGNLVDVTGTTTITTITLAQGASRTVRFTGTLTLTNGASLVLPTGANITTTAGDFAVFRGYAGGVVRCTSYTRADGSPLAGSGTPAGYLVGLRTSNNTTDSANDIDIASGKCRDGADTQDMVLASSITKRLDASWAAGTNQGGLDAGSKAASTWYAVWLIKNVSTGAVDALFSLSATNPVMPTGYTAKRRIGYICTNSSSNIIQYTQFGDEFLWSTGLLDASTTVGTTASLFTLTVPQFSEADPIWAHIIVNGGNTTNNYYIRISSPYQTDATPSQQNSQIASQMPTNASRLSATLTVLPNTANQIRVRASIASQAIEINTQGWRDQRGRI